MSEAVTDYPVVSIDTHFSNVPDFIGIDFDPQAYAAMLMDLGVSSEKAGSNNTVYIRPDYELAYSKAERVRAFFKNPFDYNDAGSCVENDQGGVDIVLVYGGGYGINKLLRHETHHAVLMLTDAKSPGWLKARKVARAEEAEADKLMKNKHLKSKFGKIVTISSGKV